MILIFWIKKYNHPEEYVMGEGGVGSGGGVGGWATATSAP